MRISEHYRIVNTAQHRRESGFGGGGKRWAVAVGILVAEECAGTVLDYGCGKGHLSGMLTGLAARGYDPAIPKFSREPDPADVVVCLDVLEHVEPECIGAVLDHLKTLTRKAGFFVVALRESNKRLIDGRNAHLIVRPREWWLEQFAERWRVRELPVRRSDELCVLVRPC